MGITQTFAKRLKEARQKKGWSQSELAKAAKTTATTVSKYEAGNETSKPSLELAAIFAQALEVSLDWLCGIKQSAEQANKITGFDSKAYLYSLVRVITELSTDIKTEGVKLIGENAASITIPNAAVISFISKITDLLKVYRAGSLTEDLYITCVDKIVNDYSSKYDFEFDRFLSFDDELTVTEEIVSLLDEDFAAGFLETSINADPSEKYYVSESSLKRIKSYLKK